MKFLLAGLLLGALMVAVIWADVAAGYGLYALLMIPGAIVGSAAYMLTHRHRGPT